MANMFVRLLRFAARFCGVLTRIRLTTLRHRSFAANYRRYANAEDGWVEEAYVSFLLPSRVADDETYRTLTTVMIDSVHEFSTRPVLLFLIGDVPCVWNSSQYPQLIVATLDTMDSRLNFYFTKIRVALLSRVKVALIAEADSLVYGSDDLFATVRKHATKHPLLPIHPDHRDPHRPPDSRQHSVMEFRYFNGSVVTNRSMPYMHAHLAWSYWNLPFLADVYVQCMARPDRSVVGSCANDEEALNVALWAIGATNQLCLFDPHFSSLNFFERQATVTPFEGPVSYSYIHGSKHPGTARELVRRMKQAEFNSKFFANGTWYHTRGDLLAHERVDCLF